MQLWLMVRKCYAMARPGSRSWHAQRNSDEWRANLNIMNEINHKRMPYEYEVGITNMILYAKLLQEGVRKEIQYLSASNPRQKVPWRVGAFRNSGFFCPARGFPNTLLDVLTIRFLRDMAGRLVRSDIATPELHERRIIRPGVIWTAREYNHRLLFSPPFRRNIHQNI